MGSRHLHFALLFINLPSSKFVLGARKGTGHLTWYFSLNTTYLFNHINCGQNISSFYFQAANRAKALFLLFGLRQFPRTMLLYLYFFDYHEILLPFLHQTCKLNAADSLPPIDPVTQVCTSVPFLLIFRSNHFAH